MHLDVWLPRRSELEEIRLELRGLREAVCDGDARREKEWKKARKEWKKAPKVWQDQIEDAEAAQPSGYIC